MAEKTETPLRPGDVVLDSYSNPAVVLKVDSNGRPSLIMQTVGSDRGNKTYRSKVEQVTDPTTIEWAREIARQQWRKGNRW